MLNIYTVFLNRLDLLHLQKKSFDKNLKNKFKLNVLDNSLKKNDTKKLKNLCKQNNIRYLRYPKKYNFRNLKPSDNAYRAYQYIKENYLDKKSEMICFIDNDIFLTRKIDISRIMENYDIAGLEQRRSFFIFSISYFWQGLILINLKKFNKEKIDLINFKPTKFPIKTDTAGSTKKIFKIYRNKTKKILIFKNTSHLKKWHLQKFFNKKLKKSYNLSFKMEFIYKDFFLHYGSGSNWRGNSQIFEKDKTIFLKNYLKSKGVK